MAASRGLDDPADRVHDHRWLIDGDDVTGFFGDDRASVLGQRDLIVLQGSPCRVGSSFPGHDDHWNGQYPA